MINTQKFEKAMNAYTIGQHQDALTYLLTLKQVGYTFEDTKEYLKQIHESEVKFNKKVQQNCPKCPAIMLNYDVNNTSGTQTGDLTDKSVWLCQNKNCMHTIYNKETVAELSKRGN